MHAWTLSEVFHELSDHGILYVEAIPCSYDGRRDIMVHILIVEDDSELNQFVCSYLNNSGFSAKGCLNARDAYDEMYNNLYDLIISDIMMPKLDGLGVLSYLRNHHIKPPLLLLTAKDTLEDKVTGLDAGADDYLVKPFEFDELLARIRVMLRRDNRENLTSSVVFGDYCLDFVKKTLTQNGQLIDLTSKEFELLECLVRHPNIVLSREQIREHIWDFDYVGESNIIDVLVKNIRKKLGNPSIIQTKRGMGYVFKNEESD